jgi:hypothetical protein
LSLVLVWIGSLFCVWCIGVSVAYKFLVVLELWRRIFPSCGRISLSEEESLGVEAIDNCVSDLADWAGPVWLAS